MTSTPTNQEALMDFSTTPHGCLTEGTETDLGIIEDVSLTAYFIAGRWVPFTRIHGPHSFTEPLVIFGGAA